MNKVVHVAVAVIVKDSHVLISKRASDVHQGGLWEFPGGKVEADESILEALEREIQEELGLQIKENRALIKLEYHYPDKSVILETRLVSAFGGKKYSFASDKKQYGLEKQLVEWVALGQLEYYQFPAANQAILRALKLPERYLITPDCLFEYETDSKVGSVKVESAKEIAEQFIRYFSRRIELNPLVQLRLPSHKLMNKSLQNNSFSQDLYQQLCRIAEEKEVELLLNSALVFSPELEGECVAWQQLGLASGIHLTSRHLYLDGFVERYRQRFPRKVMAASCHHKKDILQANRMGLDFIVLSPVQHTESHPEQDALGWMKFESLVSMAEMPVYALGGMSLSDISQAQEKGAQGIAAIRSLWQ